MTRLRLPAPSLRGPLFLPGSFQSPGPFRARPLREMPSISVPTLRRSTASRLQLPASPLLLPQSKSVASLPLAIAPLAAPIARKHLWCSLGQGTHARCPVSLRPVRLPRSASAAHSAGACQCSAANPSVRPDLTKSCSLAETETSRPEETRCPRHSRALPIRAPPETTDAPCV